MSHHIPDQTGETNEDQNPFAPKVPHETTTGERIARYAVWIGFVVASVVGIWFTRS
jgi:hypothetical protein